jgi:WD40 repeat protein
MSSRRLWRFFAALLSSSLLLLACGAPEQIGPDGGCINGPDNLRLCIPPNTLLDPLGLSITKVSPPSNAGFSALTPVYLLNPSEQLFANKATLTIPVTFKAPQKTLYLFTKTLFGDEWEVTNVRIENGQIQTMVGVLYAFALGTRVSSTGCKSGETRPCGEDKGECRKGIQTCKSGLWEPCQGDTKPSTEVCGDKKDNDCDGKTDEGCSDCTNGETRHCGSNVGECTTGTQACKNEQWQQCQGGTQPSKEVCDGKDNDCNGFVDDTLSRDCKSDCGTGVKLCKAGQWLPCNAPQPSKEVCDGKDNDCNGKVDEICTCTDGHTQPCGSVIGVCKRGRQECKNNSWGKCVGEVKPSSEVCDGKDNDCDGSVDENLSQECTSACGKGTEICKNSKWEGCSAPKPRKELCDGRDNDCNGKTDEGCDCVDGSRRSCGTNTGVCKQGTQLCSSGKWGACQGAITSTKEICDGKDNDCDGKTDESCQCKYGETQKCGSAQNGCKQGIQSCLNGVWGQCLGQTKPSTEVCDGKDNDCDGSVDENLTRSCSTACGKGSQTCSGGKWGVCSAPTPTKEVCGDKQDNDCDGLVDEGCSQSTGCTDPGTPVANWNSESPYHEVISTDFSKDGLWMAYIEHPPKLASNNVVRVYLVNLQTLHRTKLADGHGVQYSNTFVSFSPQTKFLRYSLRSGSYPYGETTYIYDLTKKKVIASFQNRTSSLTGSSRHSRFVFGPQETKMFTVLRFTTGSTSPVQTNTIVLDLKTEKKTTIKNVVIQAFGATDGTLVQQMNAASNGAGQWNLLDSTTLKVRKVLGGHSKNIAEFRVSFDGRYLASFGSDNTLKVWDVKTETLLHSMTTGTKAHQLHFDPPSQRLYFVEKGQWKFLSLQTKKVTALQTIQQLSGVEDIVFSTDGSFVLMFEDSKTAYLWDLKQVRLVRSFPLKNGKVRFSAKGDRLLISDKANKRISVVNTKDGTSLKTIKSESGFFEQAQGKVLFFANYTLYRCCSTPLPKKDDCDGLDNDCDGTVDESCGCKSLKLWKTYQKTWKGSTAYSKSAGLFAFSQPSASTGYEVELRNLTTGKKVKSIQLSASFKSEPLLTFSPDGKRLALYGEQKNFQVWDVQSGKLSVDFTGTKFEVKSVVFVPGTTTLVVHRFGLYSNVNSHEIAVFDLALKKEVRHWKTNLIGTHLQVMKDKKTVLLSGRSSSNSPFETWTGWSFQTGNITLRGTSVYKQLNRLLIGGAGHHWLVSSENFGQNGAVKHSNELLDGTGKLLKRWEIDYGRIPDFFHPSSDVLMNRFGKTIELTAPGFAKPFYKSADFSENFTGLSGSIDGTLLYGVHSKNISIWQCQ